MIGEGGSNFQKKIIREHWSITSPIQCSYDQPGSNDHTVGAVGAWQNHIRCIAGEDSSSASASGNKNADADYTAFSTLARGGRRWRRTDAVGRGHCVRRSHRVQLLQRGAKGLQRRHLHRQAATPVAAAACRLSHGALEKGPLGSDGVANSETR